MYSIVTSTLELNEYSVFQFNNFLIAKTTYQQSNLINLGSPSFYLFFTPRVSFISHSLYLFFNPRISFISRYSLIHLQVSFHILYVSSLIHVSVSFHILYVYYSIHLSVSFHILNEENCNLHKILPEY